MSKQYMSKQYMSKQYMSNRKTAKKDNDPLQESIEQALFESELSYSAFLEDRHNKHIRKARKLRTKRRSDLNLDGDSTDSPTSPVDSLTSPADSLTSPAETPLTRSLDDSTDLMGALECDDNSSGSSVVMIIDAKGNDENTDNDDITIVTRELRDSRETEKIGVVRSLFPPSKITTPVSSRQVRSGSPRTIQTKINYESDITSDDRGLLREFGDSEVRPTQRAKTPSGLKSGIKKASSLSQELNNLEDIDITAMLTKEIENCSAILTSDDECSRTDSELEPGFTNKSRHSAELDIMSELEREISMSSKDTASRDAKKKKRRSVNNPLQVRESRGARRMMKWVNDDSVDSCYGCNITFTYLNGKHHCRLCGRIFCQKCSRYKTILPMDILKDIPDRPDSYTDFLFKEDPGANAKVRVCADCFKYASDIIRIRKLIKVFELCGFNLVELHYLREFNEDWRKAADFCIDRFREIQYKLSIEELSPTDKKYIWVNRHLLSQHSRWMVLLFKSCDMSDPRKVDELQQIIRAPKKISCWDIKCSRFCSETIHLGDMLDLVKYNNNDPVISDYIMDCVSKIDGRTLMDYLPFLVSNAVNNTFLIGILLDKSQNDFSLMTHLYWCIKAFIPDKVVRRNSIIQALRYIKENCSSSFGTRFKMMIKNETISKEWIRLQNEQKKKKIVVPVCPDQDFRSIDVDNIRVMNSFSRPVIIPFQTSDGTEKLIMYKEDDIRKDYVILGVINIIHRLLNEEVGMKIDTVKYRVMPTSEETGYIEIVENARTIYDIIQQQSIQNYILNHNQDVVVSEIKDRFIKSTALYCVISYLFGFGDRHLENIMISEDGLLFHIDFGYILGQDPKYTTNKSLRVTPEIINVIGGQNTDNYRKFSECCTQIYTCLRRHVNLFSNLLSVVASIDPYITEDLIMHEIFDRFEVGENNLEAATHMDLKVRRDSGSFDYMIIDFLHRSKNSGFIKGFQYVKNVVMGRVYSNE